ncbi:MAG TPA: hypothetical protein DCZ40_09660, partial [Lachnospiraceae bacterium]|nr:hypothetical protein [Lachnospiraceae bacterium]
MKNTRFILLAGMSFLLGRVWLFQINPFAIAFFAAMCAEKKGKRLIAFTILLGMMTSADGIELIKYILLFSLVLFVDY